METNVRGRGEGTDHLSTTPVTRSERMYCGTRYKRLEAGTFETPCFADQSHVEIDATELAMLLGGVSLAGVRRRKRFTIASERSAAESTAG